MIQDVLIQPLRQIPDERGKIMHMLRVDDPYFEKFGEIYFSVVYPGIVKRLAPSQRNDIELRSRKRNHQTGALR